MRNPSHDALTSIEPNRSRSLPELDHPRLGIALLAPGLACLALERLVGPIEVPRVAVLASLAVLGALLWRGGTRRAP